MKVIEDMEKCILRSRFPNQILYIVNEQYINALVKIDKIIDGVTTHGIGILHLKKMRRQI